MDFSEIYNRYAREVYVFALYLSGNSVLADDLTSETFVHALCATTDLRVDTVKAYLFAIARNLYRDSLPNQGRLVPLDEVAECADRAPTADRAATSREEWSAMLNAIQRLPFTQREALVLSLDEDLRYEQIAAILGCSIAAVKVRIHRARLQLKVELEAGNKTCKK